MKLSEFLQGVGRPVAYFPELRKITGSTNATILLCQFIYWRGKESDQNGWLYKTSDEIQEETGLSYGEQKTARRDLVEAGILDEHYARLDHQMRFRLNLDVINERWAKPQTSVPESPKPQLGNEGNPHSLNVSEITAENTTQKVAKVVKKKGDYLDLLAENQKHNQAYLEIGEMLDRMDREFRCNFPRNGSTEVMARFIIAQEKKGQSLDRFMTWAQRDDFNASRLYEYAENPAKIKIRWAQAFSEESNSHSFIEGV